MNFYYFSVLSFCLSLNTLIIIASTYVALPVCKEVFIQLIDSNRRLVWATCKKRQHGRARAEEYRPCLGMAWLSSFFSGLNSDQGFDKFLNSGGLTFPY